MLQNKLILGRIVEDNAQNKSFGIKNYQRYF